MNEQLALLGGPRSITLDPGNLFTWPIVTAEDEAAVLDVLRRGAMSGTDITRKFEEDFATWQGRAYALAFNNGTASIQAGLYALGVGVGDEIITPSVTYWATALPAFSLGATIVFADIDAKTLCIDPADLERCIGPRTKAIVVVHYLGHPADMDAILEVADRHGIPVLEDVSHAQGGLYKGRKLGTFGRIAAMSLMSGKSLPVGEGGILVTEEQALYEKALTLGHYERYTESLSTEALRPFAGLPVGGYKYRMHQMSSAMGRVQLRHNDERCREIREATNYFWDLLDGVPGLRAHRVDEKTGSNMAGWYAPHGLYVPEELGGLSVTRFCQAVRAEGVGACSPGCNAALHTHGLLQNCDVYGHGKSTRIANATRDVRELDDALPVSETIGKRVYSIPWFIKMQPEIIRQYAGAYRKVAENYTDLLADDPGDPAVLGGWHFFRHSH